MTEFAGYPMTEFSEFLADDAGAVTIDWVALTAGVLLVGMVVVFAIFNHGVAPAAKEINDTLAGITIETSIGSGFDCADVDTC